MDVSALHALSLSPLMAETPEKGPDAKQNLEQAARSFEAFFVQMLLKEMRKTIPESGLLGKGMGKDVYDWMFDDAISKAVSRQGGLGLADLLIAKYADQENAETGLKFLEESADKGSR